MIANRILQVATVTAMNLRCIPDRLASSLVALVGIAGVVAVLVGGLSMSEGFRAVLNHSGATDVAIVLRGGATDEMGSVLSQEQVGIIAGAEEAVRAGDGAIVSPELYVVVDVPIRRTGTPANVPLRGVGRRASGFRDGFRIVQGRAFTPGTFEVIVGRGAAQQFANLELGRRVRWGTTEWEVVGVFADRGSVAESEIWTDASALQSAYGREAMYQSARVKLTDANALPAFKDRLTTDPRLNVHVIRERDYYAEQSRPVITLARALGGVFAFLMGIGAFCGALNTMYSAVTARTREIATLRAIGFGPGPVVISVLAEALLVAVFGGLVGSAAAYVTFNGVRVSTLNLATFSQLTFAFTVTPALLVQGLCYAIALGFLGGLLPGLRAARLPVVKGLREL